MREAWELLKLAATGSAEIANSADAEAKATIACGKSTNTSAARCAICDIKGRLIDRFVGSRGPRALPHRNDRQSSNEVTPVHGEGNLSFDRLSFLRSRDI